MPFIAKIALTFALFALGSWLGTNPIPIIPKLPDGGGRPILPKLRNPIFPRRAAEIYTAAAQGGTVSPDGTEEIQCDLPKRLHLRNVGGTDGAGLCVWASMAHTAAYQHIRPLEGVFNFMKTQTGGGWPERVDKVVPYLAKQAGAEIPPYIQVQARNNLDVLKLACRTGRMPGVTYAYSPTGNYNRQYINHMVSLVHASDKWFAILDNNYPEKIEWMDPQTFLAVHTRNGRENGWAYIFLGDSPPAPPKN